MTESKSTTLGEIIKAARVARGFSRLGQFREALAQSGLKVSINTLMKWESRHRPRGFRPEHFIHVLDLLEIRGERRAEAYRLYIEGSEAGHQRAPGEAA